MLTQAKCQACFRIQYYRLSRGCGLDGQQVVQPRAVTDLLEARPRHVDAAAAEWGMRAERSAWVSCLLLSRTCGWPPCTAPQGSSQQRMQMRRKECVVRMTEPSTPFGMMSFCVSELIMDVHAKEGGKCAQIHARVPHAQTSTPTDISRTSTLPRPLVWLSMNSFSVLKVPGSTSPTASHSGPTAS